MSDEYAATEAKFSMSLVDDLKGAISMGCPKPTNKGPTTLTALKLFNNLKEIAALCLPGIIKTFAFPTISENG